MAFRVPAYFDHLIGAFRAGRAGRDAHLGYWDDPPTLSTPCLPGEFAQAQARLNAVMIDLAQLDDGLSLLDAGCGFGAALEAAAKHAGMRLAGVNIDPRQIDICRSIAARGNQLDLCVADACALPFSSATFDRVLCIEAMFHFSSRTTFLQEAARVLRPGGRLVISDMFLQQPYPPGSRELRAIEACLQDEYGPWPHLWERQEDIWRAAAATGLHRDRSIDATRQTLPTHRITAPKVAAGLPARFGAGDALRWLHETGRLTYLCASFTRQGPAGAADARDY